ncbi:MAG: leucine-rich repeat domain-containing protein, partial [Planctomycetia bacterium]
LTALSAIYAGNNKIADISAVKGLRKLASLSVKKNQIRDLKPLLEITRISTLDISDNQIEDLSGLAKQTDLRLLIAERNKIADLKAVVDWCKADNASQRRFAPFLRIYLAGNPLGADANKQLDELKSMGVRKES